MTLRRFATTRFTGSHGPSGREMNGYSITVWRRRNSGILLAFNASRLSDAIAIVRAMRRRFPARMTGLGRMQYGAAWTAPDYRQPCAAPDYRAARIAGLTAYEKPGLAIERA